MTIKHFKCPKCNNTSSAIGNVIPRCKCTGKGQMTQTQMVEIKKEQKKGAEK